MAKLLFPEKVLRSFLIGRLVEDRKGLFGSAKELAQRLSELPQAAYSKPKSTEAFLSQIFKGSASIPDRLGEEILRYLKAQPHPEPDYAALLGEQLKQIISAHNEAFRERNSNLERNLSNSLWELRSDFNFRASRFECTEHFVLTTQAAIEQNREVFSFLLLVQAAALRLIAPKHSTFGTMQSIVVEAEYEPIWDHQINELNFTYVVESRRSAFLLWQGLFEYVALEITSNTDGYRIAMDAKGYLQLPVIPDAARQQAAARLRSFELKERFHILVLSEPLNAVCAAPVAAINPRLPDEIAVYSLANKWVPKFSESESRSWRQLVHSSKAELLRDAHLCHWADVEKTVMKAPMSEDWTDCGPLV